MRYKKTLMMTIILAFIITISAVSAADAVGTCDDALLLAQNQNGVGDSQEDVFRDNSSFIDNPNEPPIVEEDEVPEVDTFDDLQTQISNVEEGGVLCLTKDYEYAEGSTEGFNILKSITIDGQGHVIDCKKQSGAFKIVANNVTLKNINFRNCHDTVKFLGENNTLVNSTFTNCCDGGCLIYITSPGNLISGCEFRDCSNVKIIECSGDGNVISDSTFINCSVSSDDYISGGFVNFRSSNNSFVNSSFENCSVYSNREMSGGFINFKGSKNKLIKSSFINSYVSSNDYPGVSGGIVAFYFGEENLISESRFDNCYSRGVGINGGIVMTYGADCSIVKSSFINCSAHKRGGEDFWGGIIYLGATGNVTESTFTDCTACFEGHTSGEDCFAIYGGVIYTFWAADCIISKSNFTNCDAELGCPNYYANGGVIHFNQGIDNLLVDCKFANCNLKGTSPHVSSLVSSHIFEVPSGTVRDSSFVGCNGYNEIILDTYYRNASIQNCPTVKIIKFEASNVNVAYDSGKTYSIRVLSNYKPADTKVVVKLNGKAFKTIQTNSKGIASFKIALAPGTYKLTITALGKTLTRTLTVKNIVTLKAVTLKKFAKTLTLQASLAKVNGKYLKNKLITFKINGKKVAAAKTNAKGVAKITIKNPNVVKNLKAGKKVIYQAIYLKDTVEKTATIKK